MNISALFIAPFFACLSLNAQAAGTWQESCAEYLGAQFENGMFNGYVLITDGHDVQLSRAYGKADFAKDMLCTADTKFLIGSLTKQFTALLVLQQVEHSSLSLDQTIGSFFPDFTGAQEITIRALLSHTSGLPDFTDFPEYANFEEKNITLDDIVKKIAAHPMVFAPGTKYRYCNSNYLLLGLILEKVSGQSYERLLEKNIFTPAQMANSGVYFSDRTYANFATGYTEDALRHLPAAKPHAEFAFAAGQIYSTANDLLKWDRCLEGEALLSNELKTQMFTPGKGDYGFGWVVKKTAGMTVEFHSGALPGFRSSFYRIPEKQCAIILLCNMDSPSLTGNISNDILSYYLGKPYTPPRFRKVIPVAENVLQTYAGKYRVNDSMLLDVTVENGRLWVQPTGQEKHQFYSESENCFFVKFTDAQITFEKDDRGDVKRAILLNGDKKTAASKLP